MRSYKTNLGLYIMLPAFVAALIVVYMLVIYTRSYSYINIINIGIDGIILIYYFVNFAYKVEMDKEWIMFYSLFGRQRFKRTDLGFLVHSSFLVKFVCKKRNFYMLTTPKGHLILKEMFKDYIVNQR